MEEEKKNEKNNFNLESYLLDFVSKNSDKNRDWILSHRLDLNIQQNYFLAKKIEDAESRLLQDQFKIVQDFRFFIKRLNESKKNYSGEFFYETEINFKKEFERRILFTEKLWKDYIEKCKKIDYAEKESIKKYS